MTRKSRSVPDPIELAVFKSAVHSVAQEMGAALRRTAFSPNIKERRDYSSAVFDSLGRVIAMGDDMPVHLGSMPLSVEAVLKIMTFAPDDIVMLNDPYAGGTHLPDITLVMPVFIGKTRQPSFYVANRAHHSDVGGTFPGSMGLSREIYQEGIRIPPVKLVSKGQVQGDSLAMFLNNVRTPREREGDLTAQIGACRIGADRLTELESRYGLPRLVRNARALLDYSERLMRAELARLPSGRFEAEDFLDGDGLGTESIGIRVTLKPSPRSATLTIDFSGSDPQVKGSLNAVFAVTYSAVFYVMRCLLPPEAPPTEGLMRPVRVVAPQGSIVNARPPAAVAGGNVETSQRIVDVLMLAFSKALPNRVPAASSGSMSNITMGGIDPRTGESFTYYETIAGGMGARPQNDGISGIHTHMTNSMNTPVEALEYAYPVRVRRYEYRRGSGGVGRYRGGDGLIREIELLSDTQITVLSERRTFAPYGLAGGQPGTTGKNVFISKRQETILPGKCNFRAQAGDIIRIETPGGGGWGKGSDS